VSHDIGIGLGLDHGRCPSVVWSSPPSSRPTATATPTTASAPTGSIRPAASPCASNGRLHHIGSGPTHTGTHVLLLVHDLDVLVVHTATGELLRELTIDPTRDYQPTGRPPGPTPKKQ
jgi:hypothetical protein